MKGSHWSEVHHLRLRSSKGTTDPHREFLKIIQRGLSAHHQKLSASPDSETLQLPFTHFRFISHCFLGLRASCRHFVPFYSRYACMLRFISHFSFPFSEKQCTYSAMFATDLQKELWWYEETLHKAPIGSFLGETSYLNYPHVHILTCRGVFFCEEAARRLFVLAPTAFDIRN